MILGGWVWPHLPDPMGALDIFMILSGYLMAYHARRRGGSGYAFFPDGVRGFFVRRFFRVAPAFYLMLVLSFALARPIETGLLALQSVGADPGSAAYNPYHAEATPLNLALHFTFLFGLVPQYTSATFLPDWSISLEMQFYAVFPWLVVGIRRSRYLAPVLLLAAISLAITLLLDRIPSPVHGATSFFPHPAFLPLKLTLILIGIVIADAVAIYHDGNRRFAMILALLVIGLALCYPGWIVATAGLLLFLGFANPENETTPSRLARLIAGALGSPLARFLGVTSYGVYLVHGCCIALVGYFFAHHARFINYSPRKRVAVLTVLVFASAYSIATVIHYLVERPGIEWGRRLAKKYSALAA